VYSEMISEHHFTSWTSQLSVKLNAKNVRKDDLIQQFGQCLSVNCRNKDNEAVDYVSCKCRELALLVKCARELDPNITSLTLLTEPGQWRNLVQAMKDDARWSREEQVFGATDNDSLQRLLTPNSHVWEQHWSTELLSRKTFPSNVARKAC